MTRLASLALAAGLAAVPAHASLTFVQRGFSAGGELRFTVVGTDLNGDGYLERQNLNPIDEITGFSLTFTGNPLIAPFTLGLADLLIFGLDLNTLDFLGPDAIVFAGDFTVAYLAGGPSVGTDCTDPFFRCGIIAALEIDSAALPPVLVPAPGVPLLFGLGLAGVLALRRR
jgi:hypothetical protein